MIRVVYQTRERGTCMAWFPDLDRTADFLQTVQRPAEAIDETTGQIVGRCVEIPKCERISRRRWGWWCDTITC